MEKAAQIKSTAVEAKQVAASCIWWLESYVTQQTKIHQRASIHFVELNLIKLNLSHIKGLL